MAELVAVSFDNPQEADRVLIELTRLQQGYLIDLDDAVIAIRQPDGKVNLKQSVSMVGAGATSGSLSGALFGTFVGLLFLNPLAGFAAGALLGAGTGALSGSLIDYGINDDFIRSIAKTLKPDSSALFVLDQKASPKTAGRALTVSGSGSALIALAGTGSASAGSASAGSALCSHFGAGLECSRLGLSSRAQPT